MYLIRTITKTAVGTITMEFAKKNAKKHGWNLLKIIYDKIKST